MQQVINKKLYDTKRARCIADGEFSNGSNGYYKGRMRELYLTNKGAYFTANYTCWQGEHDSITPVTKDEAMAIYEQLRYKNCDWAEAFGEEPEEA